MFKNIVYIFAAVFMSCFFAVSPSSARDYGDDYSSESEDETILDYDQPEPEVDSGHWQNFGCKWVNYDEDRVVFHVRRSAGFFKKIRIKVGNDKAYFINARVISYDGFRKKFHIESNQSFPGQAISVQFSDIPRRIKKITLRYDAQMRPGDQTKICLSGKKVRKRRPVLTNRPPATDMSWADLGCIKASKKTNDDYIRVGVLKGHFRALRFTVRRSPAMVEDLSVTFKDGRKERLRVKGYVSAGRTSKPYFFRKSGRISVIDITSRSRSLFRNARICFQGLKDADQGYGEEDIRQRDRRETYQNIPRSEEELLDDEQYLGKNRMPNKEREDEDIPSTPKPKKPGVQSPGLDDYIQNIERDKAQKKKRLEDKKLALKRAQLKRESLAKAELEKRKQIRKKQLELIEKKRAEARQQLEKEAARQHAQQQKKEQEDSAEQKGEAAVPSDPKAEEKQAREDEEAFRKAQEKADKAQAELERQRREKADQARIDAEKQAKEQAKKQAKKQAETQARQQEEAAKKQAEIQARQAEVEAEQERLEAKRQEEKKAEQDRLAEVKKLAAKRLAEKNKIHSKKAEFPTSKISPDKEGWINYGCQQFGKTIEERYIPVGRLQGTFTKIRVRVSGNSLTLKKMSVVYGNGKSEPLIRYSSRVKLGEKTSDYKLSHRRRFISEVRLKAQARDRGNSNKSLVCLEAYR